MIVDIIKYLHVGTCCYGVPGLKVRSYTWQDLEVEGEVKISIGFQGDDHKANVIISCFPSEASSLVFA